MSKMPLALYKPRKTKKDKRIPLSMNRYRNAQFFESNWAKKEYTKIVEEHFTGVEMYTPIEIEYKFYADNNRRVDLDNRCIVHSKFFADALVGMGILPDDTCEYIRKITFQYGGVDKGKGRVEIYIS